MLLLSTYDLLDPWVKRARGTSDHRRRLHIRYDLRAARNGAPWDWVYLPGVARAMAEKHDMSALCAQKGRRCRT